MSKLTKYEKETIVLFNEADEEAHIQTYNAGLRKRLEAFSKKYPDLCRLDMSMGQGGVSYWIDKSRLSIRFQPPMSEERRRKQANWRSKTVLTVRTDNVAFRVCLRSKCRVCTRCFDCYISSRYKVLTYPKKEKYALWS